LDAAHREGFHHLSARIDGSEYPVLNAFAQRGFYPVDCSVKMAGWLSKTPHFEPVSASGMCVRRYRADDLPVLQKIAANEHPYNHYYNDPHLPREATGRLFEGWVERCCNGLASDVFVLDASGEPKGFVIYLEPVGLNHDMGTRLAILDFVCLDPSARGGGVGRRFIAETLQALGGRFNMVELRTSQNNYPAMACYMDLGLRIISTDFVLHGIL
jgi:ribosomal protein S18 acetylase RimI-like enzyme